MDNLIINFDSLSEEQREKIIKETQIQLHSEPQCQICVPSTKKNFFKPTPKEMTSIELINLTLNEIRRSAQVVADVITEEEMVLSSNTNSDSKVREIMEQTIESGNNALVYCRKALRDVLEHIAEYQNSRDMLRGVDAELGKVAYDLIYELKTDEDYE